MQFSMLTGMLPSTMLSGFVFPVASMPRFFWYFTMLLPARWFMVIARHTFLEGSSLAQLAVPFAALGLSCVVMVTLAVRKFKRTLEMNRTLLGFIKKELIQALRDPRMKFILFVTPIVQMTIFGVAVSNEVKNIRLAAFFDSKDYVHARCLRAGDPWRLVHPRPGLGRDRRRPL